jgi:hypothetical protein
MSGELMAFEDTPDAAATIGEKLRAYMAGPPKRGAVAIANDIKRNHQQLGGTVAHDTVKRCHGGTAIRASSLKIIYNFLTLRGQIIEDDNLIDNNLPADEIFKTLTDFFDVREHNLDLCSLLEGDYSLFFRSEDISEKAIVGAMRFTRSDATTAFEVQELQESKRPRRVERWNGYYFARRERIVVILRGEGRILRNAPKFYILNTPHADEGETVTEIGGTMLKFGSGGTQTGAFSAKVLLRRENDAFGKCEVLPLADIDQDVLREI